ncbi:MAG TPA: FAD:protein FMN transferase [Candidatus Dormibacteraeota bacterium]|nr:FAD:protein FMN transferase [Candidatus Dormibacteraeota bacterium]
MSVTVLGIADDRALGGSVRVIVSRPTDLGRAKAAVDKVLRAIDLAASRFREDSELSRLNAMPEQEVVVSRLLAQAIAAALRGARLSGGAVDPTIGSAVRLAGYDADFASVPVDGGELKLTATTVPGWQAVQFGEASRTVRIPTGVQLDLGATAKALASDLAAAAAIKACGGGGVLVSLGGDIAVAGEAPAEGWLIQTSEDSGAAIAEGEETVSIRTGGIATSSTTVRRWMRGGTILHHIIDPATGLPADSCWRTASVIAATCVDANIASTAAIVMGLKAVPWLEANRLPGRLVDLDGSVHRAAGWPSPAADSDRLPNIL